jgi:hypothetical protein
MPAAECPHQRRMLHSRRIGCQRGLLEFELPVRTDGDRTEQFLLQQWPSLYRLRRCTRMLQRTSRQWPVSIIQYAAQGDVFARYALLRPRLCRVRQCLLPRQSNDLDGQLLSKWPSPERSKQSAMQAAHSHSNRAALLRRGPHSGQRRQMLSARKCNERRRVLPRTGEHIRPRALPSAYAAAASLRGRIHADA